MIIQACLNGARSHGFHSRLPLTVEALMHDAADVVRAGAAELHLHVRNQAGDESLAPLDVELALLAVRTAVPGTLVGISTGAWIVDGDEDRRLALISAWRELPDHASVNLSEPGAPAVIELLHRRGVAIEAGLASLEDVERLQYLDLGRLCLRFLVEIGEQGLDEAMAIADAVLTQLAEGGIRKPVLLHGQDATVWPFVERAARSRLSTRVGLEDGDRLPDGTVAASNAELVKAARAIMLPG